MAKGKVQVDITAKDEASGKLKAVGTQGDKLKGMFKNMAIAAAAAAAAISAAVGKMLTDWTRAGDEIAKTAKRMGWGTEAVSEMAYVAKLGGASLSDLETAQKRLSKAIVDAEAGLATYVRAFDRLGVSVDDLIGLEAEDQFWLVAMALANVEDTATRTATAMDLFGRSGTNLVPMLDMGAEAIGDAREAAHDLGIVFSEEAAASAEAMNDAMTTLKGSMEGLRNALVEDLAPILTDLIENQIVPAVTSLKDWAKENDDVVQSLVGLINAVATLVGLIATLYDKLLSLGRWFGEHKGMWDVLSAIQPMVFWPKKMQEGLFGGTAASALKPGIEEKYGGQASYMMAGGNTFEFNIGNYMGDEQSQYALADEIANKINEAIRRTSFASVNATYYPGSSAP